MHAYGDGYDFSAPGDVKIDTGPRDSEFSGRGGGTRARILWFEGFISKSASRQSVCSLLYGCFVWAEYIKLQCARLKPREEWYYGCELYMCLHLRCFKSGVVSRVICAQDPGSMGIPMCIHLNQFVFN